MTGPVQRTPSPSRPSFETTTVQGIDRAKPIDIACKPFPNNVLEYLVGRSDATQPGLGL